MSERVAAEPATLQPLGLAAQRAVSVAGKVIVAAGPVAAALILVAVPERASGGAIATFVATGLVAVGAVAWVVALRTPGGAAIAAGACLGLVAAADTVDTSALDRALGAAAAPLLPPLLAIVVTRTPLGWVALAAGAAAGPVRALVYDPFLDPGCTERCVESPLTVSYHGALASGLLAAGTIVAAAALTLVALRSARRWQLVAVAAAGWAMVFDRALGLTVVAAAVALLVLTSDVVERTTARRRLERLIRSFRTTGDVQETLRRELGDDTLLVA
ncbi:MAG: hypothetical protein ACRC50_10835, partial [Gaiella sp.]